jgi:hypothetical protein
VSLCREIVGVPRASLYDVPPGWFIGDFARRGDRDDDRRMDGRVDRNPRYDGSRGGAGIMAVVDTPAPAASPSPLLCRPCSWCS